MKCQEDAEHTPNISQRAYVIAKSLSELKASLFTLLGLVLFFLFFAVLNAYTPPSDPDFYKQWIPLTFIITSVGLIWYRIKGKQLDQNFKDWTHDYTEQTYILVFDTTVPKGDTTGEKILSLARIVFPELRSNYIPPRIRDRIKLYFKRKVDKPQHIIVSESMNYKVGPEYSVDLALRTPEGYFIVKDFKDKVVTPEELRHLAKTLAHKFRDIGAIPPRADIFRVMCVAKAYDAALLNTDTLEQQMTKQLKANFDIDLLLQEKVGYSVVWIS